MVIIGQEQEETITSWSSFWVDKVSHVRPWVVYESHYTFAHIIYHN